MCFNQRGDISTLKGGPLKRVEKFTYFENSISSTEKDIKTGGERESGRFVLAARHDDDDDDDIWYSVLALSYVYIYIYIYICVWERVGV